MTPARLYRARFLHVKAKQLLSQLFLTLLLSYKLQAPIGRARSVLKEWRRSRNPGKREMASENILMKWAKKYILKIILYIEENCDLQG